MSWRLANSLTVLRDQINALAPGRSKATDGTIGDPAHASRRSRHNPNADGVVCAIDLTNDPAHGCPIHRIAEHVVANPHPDLAYVISERRVASRTTGWVWHRYTGASPHTAHAHFAVGVGRDPLVGDPSPRPPYDDTAAWAIAGGPAVVSGKPPRTLRRGSKGEDVRGLQYILIGAGLLPPGSSDGIFGPATEAAVRKLQRRLALTPDGVVGPKTHTAITQLLAFLAALPPAA